MHFYFVYYYWVYRFCSLSKGNFIPQVTAVCVLSVLLGMKLFIIYDILNIINGDVIFKISSLESMLLGTLIIIINFIIFIRNDYYKNIIEQYKKIYKDSYYGLLTVVVVIVFSLIGIFVLGKETRELNLKKKEQISIGNKEIIHNYILN